MEFETFLFTRLESEYANYTLEQKKSIASDMAKDTDEKIAKKLESLGIAATPESKAIFYSNIETQIERDGLESCTDSNGQISIQNIQKAEEFFKQSTVYAKHLETITNNDTQNSSKEQNTFVFSEEQQKILDALNSMSIKEYSDFWNNISEEDRRTIINNVYNLSIDDIYKMVSEGRELEEDAYISKQIVCSLAKNNIDKENVSFILGQYVEILSSNNFNYEQVQKNINGHIKYWTQYQGTDSNSTQYIEILERLKNPELVAELDRFRRENPEKYEEALNIFGINLIKQNSEQIREENIPDFQQDNKQIREEDIPDFQQDSEPQIGGKPNLFSIDEEDFLNLGGEDDELGDDLKLSSEEQEFPTEGLVEGLRKTFTDEFIEKTIGTLLGISRSIKKEDISVDDIKKYLENQMQKEEGQDDEKRAIAQILSTESLLSRLPNILNDDQKRLAFMQNLQEVSQSLNEMQRPLSEQEIEKLIGILQKEEVAQDTAKLQDEAQQSQIAEPSGETIEQEVLEEPNGDAQTPNSQDDTAKKEQEENSNKNPFVNFLKKHPMLASLLPKTVRKNLGLPIAALPGADGRGAVGNPSIISSIIHKIGELGDSITERFRNRSESNKDENIVAGVPKEILESEPKGKVQNDEDREQADSSKPNVAQGKTDFDRWVQIENPPIIPEPVTNASKLNEQDKKKEEEPEPKKDDGYGEI